MKATELPKRLKIKIMKIIDSKKLALFLIVFFVGLFFALLFFQTPYCVIAFFGIFASIANASIRFDL